MPINTRPDIHEYVICANLFVKKGDSILVLKRSPMKKYAPNVIHPIGGKVDLGENPYEAAMREVAEESGVKVNNIKLEAVVLEIQPHKKEPYDWLIFHFSGDYESGEVAQTEEGELLWMTADEIKQSDLFPSVGEVIEHIMNNETGTVFATFAYEKTGASINKRKIYLCKS